VYHISIEDPTPRFSRNGSLPRVIEKLFFFDRAELSKFKTIQEFHGGGAKQDAPEVGLHMYVAGRDEWWYSTEITSIEMED
jgi:hypothetical protein